jgi:hypothetical protein
VGEKSRPYDQVTVPVLDGWTGHLYGGSADLTGLSRRQILKSGKRLQITALDSGNIPVEPRKFA